MWVVLAVVVLLVALKMKAAHRSPEQLAQVRQALDAGAPLVDVRSAGEFGPYHLRGAVNVPVGDLSKQALKKIGPKDKPVVLYCASGTRSAMMARSLRQAGYQEVYDLGPIGNYDKLPQRA
jgi:rhodanese-related sulfurtransferase